MKKLITVLAIITISLSTGFSVPEPDQAYYKDFIKFLEVSGGIKSQKVMIKLMLEQFKKMPSMDPEKLAKMQERMTNELLELNKQLFPVYKKYLSHEDMKELIKFYESPAGKRFVEAQPFILKESFKIGSDWGRKLTKQLLKE